MTIARKSGRLNAQESRFVEEYLVDFDAKAAALRAGYPRRAAASTGARLLGDAPIAAAIEKAVAARREKIRVTADRVVEEYAHIAFANLHDFYDWDRGGAKLRPKGALTEADTAAIAELKTNGKGGSVSVKLYNKMAALNALARHLGLFDPKARGEKAERTIDGRDAREVLRERIEKLMQKRGN